MADLTITTSALRVVRDDPEDERTYDAASGYTPALGDLVAMSGNEEVDKCDATDANGLVEPVGIVTNIQSVRTNAGAAGHRVTVARRALVEGFESLSAGAVFFNSTTAGKIEDTDPTTTGVTGIKVGIAHDATKIDFVLPALG